MFTLIATVLILTVDGSNVKGRRTSDDGELHRVLKNIGYIEKYQLDGFRNSMYSSTYLLFLFFLFESI